jgi:hypothetical protein
MDVAHREVVEKQLDALIQRRARKGGVDPDQAEERAPARREPQGVVRLLRAPCGLSEG